MVKAIKGMKALGEFSFMYLLDLDTGTTRPASGASREPAARLGISATPISRNDCLSAADEQSRMYRCPKCRRSFESDVGM